MAESKTPRTDALEAIGLNYIMKRPARAVTAIKISEVFQLARQLETELAEVRAATIEECAKVCEKRTEVVGTDYSIALYEHSGNQSCAQAIRARSPGREGAE